jgi:peptidoglycan hydrolase CwlO-like protein
VSIGALAAVAAALTVGSSRGDLASRYAAGQQRAGEMQSEIQAGTAMIDGYQGSIADLRARFGVIQHSVAIQAVLLGQVRVDLSATRQRLALLEAQYAHDRRVLAAQLVADYESPPPTLVDVVLESGGFEDLLDKMHDLEAIARQNAQTTRVINTTRLAVAAQARRLAQLAARRQWATAAMLVERDEIAQLRLSLVTRELATARARAQRTSQLRSLRQMLAREAAALERRAATAQAGSSATGSPPPGGCVNSPFVRHGGEYGFFPAPGTNYTVGEEPIIAARLDALGRALQLQLIGISGYRTPQHSVEVGGFADDPHTRGEASDTPGVEGVPESTLERFCLTRPFPGPREADHIQEL